MPTKESIYKCNECQTQYEDFKTAEDCEKQGKPTTIPVGTFFKLKKAWAHAPDYAVLIKEGEGVCSLGHRMTNQAYEFTCDRDMNIITHEEVSILSFPDGSFNYLDNSVMEIQQLTDSERGNLCARRPIMRKALELVLEGIDPIDSMKKMQETREKRRKNLRDKKYRERKSIK